MIFPFVRETAYRDRCAADCVAHHAVSNCIAFQVTRRQRAENPQFCSLRIAGPVQHLTPARSRIGLSLREREADLWLTAPFLTELSGMTAFATILGPLTYLLPSADLAVIKAEEFP